MLNSEEIQVSSLLSEVSRLAVGPNQPPIQWVLEALLSWVKWQGSEVEHLLLSNDEVKNAVSYISTLTQPLGHVQGQHQFVLLT